MSIDRYALTRIFLKQSGKASNMLNVKYYERKWWKSVRTSKMASYRLSDEGLEYLIEEVKLIPYTINLKQRVSLPQEFIFIDKYIDCPYHLSTDVLTVFAEKKAIELAFFADDIKRYGMIKAMEVRM